MTTYAIYTLWLQKEWVPYLSVGLFETQKEALTKAQECADVELAAFPNDPRPMMLGERTDFPKTMKLDEMAALLATGKATVII